nr:hypothetical protein [Tanacetum cinerariifolium]
MINDGTVTHIETDNKDRFKMVFIAFDVVIRRFKKHMRPLIIIDAAHLKGIYQGTNLLAVGMDGNNQIIPIATGVSQGETGPSWTWFLSKLKECIGEVPNLSIISDRHATIKSACQVVFPNAFHGYSESINSLTRDVRKIPITKLMEWYRDLVQMWYCERQDKYRDAPLNELSDWATTKITKRRQKSVTGLWTQLIDFNHLAKRWFRRKALEGTYQELVYPLGEVSSWQRPNYLQVVKPPLIDKNPAGTPKSTARIRSQGEEPVPVRCGRCGARGHNQYSCRETIPQNKAKTGYSQKEHYYSEQEHYYF